MATVTNTNILTVVLSVCCTLVACRDVREGKQNGKIGSDYV